EAADELDRVAADLPILESGSRPSLEHGVRDPVLAEQTTPNSPHGGDAKRVCDQGPSPGHPHQLRGALEREGWAVVAGVAVREHQVRQALRMSSAHELADGASGVAADE